MTQTHSPTPWQVSDIWLDEIWDADGNACASGCGALDFENAKFIVTACNAYEANQALIKQLVEALHSIRVQALQSDMNKTSDEWGMEALNKSKAALSAAKAGGF